MPAPSSKATPKATPKAPANDIAKPPANNTVKALALDGGGVRGYISALILQQIELNIVKELGLQDSVNLNETNIIKDHFEVIAGTSAGAILAAAIAVGMPINKIIVLYEQNASIIFPHNWFAKGINTLKHTLNKEAYWQNLLLKGIDKVKPIFQRGLRTPKYSDAGLRDVLMTELGDIKLGDVNTTLLIQSYDATNHHPAVFKTKPNTNHDVEEASNHRIMRELPLWEVVKASASAPLYLPAHKLLSVPKQPVGHTEYYSAAQVKNDDKLKHWTIFDSTEKYERFIKAFNGGAFLETAMIDGGVFANNPSLVALAEIFSKYHIHQTIEINSEPEYPNHLKPILVSIGAGEAEIQPISIRKGRKWGGIKWVKPLIDVFMGGASSHVHNLAERILGNNYLRFEVYLDEDIELDDSDDRTLQKMKVLTQNYLKDEVSCDIQAPNKFCFSNNMAQLISFLTEPTK